MKSILFLGFSLFVATSVMFVESCSKSNGYNNNSSPNNSNPPPATSNTIKLNGMAFSPASLTIKPGTTVTWNNNDNTAHTVTADDASFDSGNLAVGKTYTRIFTISGSYPYHCNFHSGMTGTIIVQP